jgi:hypothetical protein
MHSYRKTGWCDSAPPRLKSDPNANLEAGTKARGHQPRKLLHPCEKLRIGLHREYLLYGIRESFVPIYRLEELKLRPD